MFTQYLEKIVDQVGDGIGAVIMGLDGIAVETYIRDQHSFDVSVIGMEFSFILTQVKKAAEALKIGGLSDFVIKAEQLTLVIRMLTDEYFVAVALMPSGNLGKCRFLLRLIAPQIIREL